MSEYFKSRSKLLQGENWRGEIDVEIDGETYVWSIRQLNDDEYFDVVGDISTESFSDLREQVDEEKVEEYRTLRDRQDSDDDEVEPLSDEEEERLEELQGEIEEQNFFNDLDKDTFRAIRRAAIYGVVPSDEDVDYIMENFSLAEQEEKFGERFNSRDEAYEWLSNDIEERLDNATDLLSFEVGMKVLNSTTDVEEDEGNSTSS